MFVWVSVFVCACAKKHSPNDRKRNLANCHLLVAGSINFPLCRARLCVFGFDDVMMAPADFLTAYHVIYIKFTFLLIGPTHSMKVWTYGSELVTEMTSRDMFSEKRSLSVARILSTSHIRFTIWMSKLKKNCYQLPCVCWWFCIFLCWLKNLPFVFLQMHHVQPNTSAVKLK